MNPNDLGFRRYLWCPGGTDGGHNTISFDGLCIHHWPAIACSVFWRGRRWISVGKLFKSNSISKCADRTRHLDRRRVSVRLAVGHRRSPLCCFSPACATRRNQCGRFSACCRRADRKLSAERTCGALWRFFAFCRTPAKFERRAEFDHW